MDNRAVSKDALLALLGIQYRPGNDDSFRDDVAQHLQTLYDNRIVSVAHRSATGVTVLWHHNWVMWAPSYDFGILWRRFPEDIQQRVRQGDFDKTKDF